MKHFPWAGALAVAVLLLPMAAPAGTVQRLAPPGNVSRTPTPTEKAKLVRLAYADGAAFRKAWLFTYADGPQGRQNIYARASFDNGQTWAAPVLLSRDGAGAATGGQSITAATASTFVADNDQPSVFAPPTTRAPMVVIAWNSAYCPQDPVAAQAGTYSSIVQGAGDFDGDGVADRPYHCEWVATSTDPALVRWDVQQLTNGERDAANEVLSGNATGSAFAMAWQEDPAGLQPGEAEGPGDGGSGANVSGGTNIWYSRAASPSGAALRANVVQLSDDDVRGTGQPGASRPNLQLSGSTAVVAYEETACAGGSGGKCIVYHAFPFAQPDRDAPGTIISDVTHSARRVRFVLQGAAAAGDSALRAVVLWRDSAVASPGAPADIVLRRGLVDPQARPGSTGLLASDILADTPQQMTRVAAVGGNANAHRAIVRGGFVALAYDLTPDMAAANPQATTTPTALYNLYFARSLADGAAGSWSDATNLSGIQTPSLTVVEPRMVPTPGTIIDPLTQLPDPGDAQDSGVFYISYATQGNDAAASAGQVFVSRSTDQGATFEPFVPVADGQQGQSEAQIRPSPDGATAMVMWMGQQTPGDARTKDAMFALASSVERPDLVLFADSAPFTAGSAGTMNFVLRNLGGGSADPVTLTASLPDGLRAGAVTGAARCGTEGGTLRCELGLLPRGQTAIVSIEIESEAVADYSVSASVTSGELDEQPSDNTTTASISAVKPTQAPAEVGGGQGGGGCTTAGDASAFDPLFPVLLLGAALASARRRVVSRRRPCRDPSSYSD